MGFFSVLKSPDDAVLRVERCHVNLWSLPGLFSHRPMILDVGVLFTPQTDTRKLSIALPGKTEPRIEDLSEAVKTNGELLFARTFDRIAGSTVYLTDLDPPGPTGNPTATPVRLIPVKSQNCVIEQTHGRYVTVWRLELAAEAVASNRAYVRFRVYYDHPGRMWIWRRVLARRNFAIVDFRVSDRREAAAVKQTSSLADEMERVVHERVDVFVIAPDRYRLTEAHPSLTYTRLLEGSSWASYMPGLRGIRGENKMLVYRWGRANVSVKAPFRGFLHLNRQPGFLAPSDLLIGALAVALVVLAFLAPLSVRNDVRDFFSGFGSALGVGALAILGGLSLGLLVTLLRMASGLGRFSIKAKRYLKRIERSVMRALEGLRGG